MNAWMDGGMHGQPDGEMNECMDGRTDGRMDGGAVILCSFLPSLFRTVSPCDPGTCQISTCLWNE